MSNKDRSKLVPKLRFPEFLEITKWDIMQLGTIFDNRQEKGFDSLPLMSLTDEYGLIPQTDTNKKDSSNWDKSKYLRICIGDVVYNTMRMWQGRCAYSGVEGIVSPAYTVCMPKQGNNGLFFYYYFKTSSMIREFHANSQGLVNDTLNLKYDDFSKILIAHPLEPEQDKIADCLSSLDYLIKVQNQKLETLKKHKKGLMQKLFPAEGKTFPEWRFPEFRGSGEWEKRLVENFFVVGSSKRVLQENWTSQGVPFYRTRELVSLSKNEPFSSEIFISEKLFCELAKKYGVPSEGDFLISGVGTLGISYQVQTGDKFYFKDGNVLWFKLKTGLYSTYFKYCFESDYIQNQIIKQTSISTVGTYTIQNAKQTKFWYPPNSEEQKKIADCLSALDYLITSQTEKIEALKAHKKGLMQEFFPSIEEVGK
jgi:Restriction endonuclease S subunits